jgi:hypothetical protein
MAETAAVEHELDKLDNPEKGNGEECTKASQAAI